MSKKKRIESLEGRVSDLEVLLDNQDREFDKLRIYQKDLYERMITELKERILAQNEELNRKDSRIKELEEKLKEKEAHRTVYPDPERRGVSTSQLVNEWVNGEEADNE